MPDSLERTVSRLDGHLRAQFREVSYRQGLIHSLRTRLRRCGLRIGRLRARSWRFNQFGNRSLVGRGLRVSGADRISIGNAVHIGRDCLLSVTVHRREPRAGSLLTIGDRTVFGDRLCVSCCGAVTIGHDVLGAHDVFITDTYHDYHDPALPISHQPLVESTPVLIEDGSFLGRGCAILHGVTVGQGAFVGANAVVVADVPPRSVVAGNPARVIRRWNEASGRWMPEQP